MDVVSALSLKVQIALSLLGLDTFLAILNSPMNGHYPSSTPAHLTHFHSHTSSQHF